MVNQTTSAWNNYLIREISKVKGGKRLPKGQFVQDEKTQHPYIRVTDMYPDHLDTSNIKYITDEQFEKIKRYTISSNDVYVSNAGTIGLVGKVPDWLSGANLTENALKLTDIDNTKVIQDFIIYYLRSSAGQDQIKARTGGSSQPKLALTRLADVTLSVPDVRSQEKIVNILNTYNDLIENNTRRIQLLESTVNKIYKKWFTSVNNWNKVNIGECLSISRGKSYSGKDLEVVDGSVPFVNLKCIKRNGGFRKDGLKPFSGTYKNSHVVRKGDIVMAVTDMTQERMIIARSARVPSLGSDFGVISMDLIKIEPKENCNRDYLYAYLRWSDFADNVKNYANGANVLHLLPDRVAEYEIFLPPLELQEKFSSVVKDMFEQIDVLELACDNLKKTRDLLIPQLVTGKLAIKS